MVTRILNDPDSRSTTCHIFANVVGGMPVLGEAERNYFAQLLERMVDFSGLENLAWCCLPDRFHLLIRVPDPEPLRKAMTQTEVLDRIRKAFDEGYLEDVKRRLRAGKTGAKRSLTLDQLKGQFFDVSKFMHMLKRHFTLWFNRIHQRRGTLWEARFGSVLVEQSEHALSAMSAYIDLAPVRAGLVDDPADYPWCGYGQACCGKRAARRAIAEVQDSSPWKRADSLYRERMFGAEGQPVATDLKALKRKLKSKKPLTLPELLRCEVRYFYDGEAVGSKDFIERVFQGNRDYFGPNRASGARALRYGDWGGLHSLRDLRVDPVLPPGP